MMDFPLENKKMAVTQRSLNQETSLRMQEASISVFSVLYCLNSDVLSDKKFPLIFSFIILHITIKRRWEIEKENMEQAKRSLKYERTSFGLLRIATGWRGCANNKSKRHGLDGRACSTKAKKILELGSFFSSIRQKKNKIKTRYLIVEKGQREKLEEKDTFIFHFLQKTIITT